MSGSAVETVQYKYAAGGKLDAANYSMARAACLVQRAVAPAHHSGTGYRDMPLDTLVPNLEKRRYNRTK